MNKMDSASLFNGFEIKGFREERFKEKRNKNKTTQIPAWVRVRVSFDRYSQDLAYTFIYARNERQTCLEPVLDLVWREATHHWRKRKLRIGEIDLNYKTEKILNSLAFILLYCLCWGKIFHEEIILASGFQVPASRSRVPPSGFQVPAPGSGSGLRLPGRVIYPALG
ncbi:hypothetical protein F2Q68_00039274 [Brassica cretica]|uniref:Uncharacterized protein n=1 Tax=Brassica cretica TaxID=69181 RepID=A0A8S9MLV1_BRACR|nr:hypothetical protein F2Q68_00039274 [Brassica cretica]